jgi:hypothetical protein
VPETNNIKFTLCFASRPKAAITVQVTKCKRVEQGNEKALKKIKNDRKEKRRQSKGGNKGTVEKKLKEEGKKRRK